jgi:hypothetical protein
MRINAQKSKNEKLKKEIEDDFREYTKKVEDANN